MSVHYSREQRAIADRDNKALVTVALPGFTFQGAVEKKDVESLNAFVMDWITARYKPAVSNTPRTDMVATFTYKDGSTYTAKAFKSVRGISRQIEGEYCRPNKLDFSRDLSEVFDFITDRVHIEKLKQWIEMCKCACRPMMKGGTA